MIATVDKELFADIIYGFVAFMTPLALYIAYLDLKDRHHDRRALMRARALTRIGATLVLAAIALRSLLDEPPIEHAALWLTGVFLLGLALSFVGLLGVAWHFRTEDAIWRKAYDREKRDPEK